MKKTKLIVGAVVVLAAAGIIFRIMNGQEKPAEYETRPTVSVEQPGKGDIVLYTDLTGTLEPQSSASVMPKIGGELLEVSFQAGDQVEAGQVLARIDSDALTALKLQMDSASVAADEARRALERTQPLYASGYVSQQAYEQAQDGAESARLAYESAKNQYELQVKYTTVTAPISGVIESRNVEVHDHINTSTVLCEIAGSDQMEVSFGVTEKIRTNMSVGDAVTVTKNGLTYNAVVTETGSVVNSSGLYDAKAILDQSEGLTNGMRVKLTVVMDQALGALTVPVDAVSYSDGQPFVYCYDNGTAKKTEIEAGIYDSDNMAVASGLDQNSLVITSWSNELVDGGEVIMDAAQKAGE